MRFAEDETLEMEPIMVTGRVSWWRKWLAEHPWALPAATGAAGMIALVFMVRGFKVSGQLAGYRRRRRRKNAR